MTEGRVPCFPPGADPATASATRDHAAPNRREGKRDRPDRRGRTLGIGDRDRDASCGKGAGERLGLVKGLRILRVGAMLDATIDSKWTR
jgi:hypothetical protein